MPSADGERVAVVTGGAGGQGAAVARRLAEDGMRVAVLDVAAEAAEAVAAGIDPAGERAIAVECDIATQDSVDAAFAAVRRRLGPPWCLAATAAILEGEPALEAPAGHLERVLAVNALGVMRTDIAAARAMVEAGDGGRIINWSSISAGSAAPGYAAYSASKAAVEAFTQTLAVELAPHAITVNAIRPGSIRTPMLGGLTAEQLAHEATARIPLGRIGEPDDVAGLAAFLAGADAAWITAATFTVDGGGSALRAPVDPDDLAARLAAERRYR